MTICPKCGYARREHDAGVHAGTCPACGIAYIKWQEAQAAAPLDGAAGPAPADGGQENPDEALFVPVASFWQRAHHYTCFMPSDGHVAAFWAHVAVYLIFLLWGLRFMLDGIDSLAIGASFLHAVNLPFHEYGHVLFRPFGAFWMYLGGSLFQILLPLVPLAYFMGWQRDNFAASMMLWWSGQNFIDVAPYIADAQLRALPLIGGGEDDHDWWNLLVMAGKLDHADRYASLCFFIGACVLLGSNAWGAYLLSIEFRGRTRPRHPVEEPLR